MNIQKYSVSFCYYFLLGPQTYEVSIEENWPEYPLYCEENCRNQWGACRFFRATTLHRHYAVVHRNKTPEYRCTCGISYYTPALLSLHQRLHNRCFFVEEYWYNNGIVHRMECDVVTTTTS